MSKDKPSIPQAEPPKEPMKWQLKKRCQRLDVDEINRFRALLQKEEEEKKGKEK